jgi:large-conductance mechanosensitive channel
VKALYILPLIGAIAGAFDIWGIFTTSQISAPQQAAGATIAVAWAVIPYVFVRAIEKMASVEERELKRLNETLTGHTKLLAEIANAAAEKSESAEVGL